MEFEIFSIGEKVGAEYEISTKSYKYKYLENYGSD